MSARVGPLALPFREWYHTLSVWVEGFADSPWALVALAANSFSDALFFPIPPDPLMIAISLPQRHMAIWFALLTTAASVVGAVAGYWLGRRFGRPAMYRFAKESTAHRVESMFERYGAWAVIIAAITPLPYKVFAISAGVLDMDLRRFVLASIVGRGLRFLAIGFLITLFGESVRNFLETNLEEVTIASTVGFVGLVVAVIAFKKLRDWHSARASSNEVEPEPDREPELR